MRRDPKALNTLASRHGLDGVWLLAEAGNVAVQAEYRDNTRRALSAGVFGSPFYMFADELFWGQDRLDMRLRGHLLPSMVRGNARFITQSARLVARQAAYLGERSSHEIDDLRGFLSQPARPTRFEQSLRHPRSRAKRQCRGLA